MTIVYTIIFLLVFYSLTGLFKVSIADVLELRVNAETAEIEARSQAISKKKEPFLFAHKRRVESLLPMSTLVKLTWERYLDAVLAFGMIGVSIGMALNNPFLAIVLCVCLACLPYIYLTFAERKYERRLVAQMEMAISIITNTYMQVTDLQAAVKSSLENTGEPLRSIFNEFCTDYDLGMSIPAALALMRDKIDNKYWREWIDRLIQCQDNRSLVMLLPPIPKALSEQRQIQMELDTMMQKIWSQHLSVALIAIGLIPFVTFINAEWGQVLWNTTIGKLIVALDVAVVGVGTWYALRVNTPLSAEV